MGNGKTSDQSSHPHKSMPPSWGPGYIVLDAQGKPKLCRPKVAIFGAGIGGLTAAQELAERGFNVHVFERQSWSYPGGLAGSQWHTSDRIKAMFRALYGPNDTRLGPAPLTAAVEAKLRKSAREERKTQAAAAEERNFKFPAEHGFRFFPGFYCHVIDTMKRIPIWDRLDLPDVFPDKQHFANPDRRQQREADFFRPPFRVADNLVTTNKCGLAFGDGFRLLIYDRRQPKSGAGAFSMLLLWLFGLGHEARDFGLMAARMYQYLTSCRERRLVEYERMSFWDFIGAEQTSPRMRDHLGRYTRMLSAMDARLADARTVMNVLIRMVLDQSTMGQTTDRVLNGPTSERWIIPWVTHLRERLGVKFHWNAELVKFVVEDGRVVDALVNDVTPKEEPEKPDEEAVKPKMPQSPMSIMDHPADEAGMAVTPKSEEWGNDKFQYFLPDLPLHGLWQVLGNSPGLLEADRAQTEVVAIHDFPQRSPDPPLEALRGLLGPDSNPLMSGMQFYLSEPIQILPGHINFVESEWALTAIVQTQFWGEDVASRYGAYVVRAILSVDIAEFDTPGPLSKKTVRQIRDEILDPNNPLTLNEGSDLIAKEVWYQLAKGIRNWEINLPDPLPEDQDYALPLPDPDDHTKEKDVTFPIPLPYLDHHIDWGLCRCSSTCDPKDRFRGGDPKYFITAPGSWHKRPGPLPTFQDNERGYRVRVDAPNSKIEGPGGLVVAGVYAQTFTGLNTMEAANESARHAVNGILRHVEDWLAMKQGTTRAFRYEKCSIWPLEETEPADLASLKQLDRRLWELNDPHQVQIQGFDALVDHLTKICNVENQSYSPEQFQEIADQILWPLNIFGRADPF
jgi:hypothetical protein